MKIGIDVRLWSQTGVGRYIRNLVSSLHKIDSNNEYVLFCQTSDISSIKDKVSSSKWKLKSSDIRWHSIKEQILFPQIINREELDLMHFTYFSIPIFYNRPFIVTIHDLIVYHFQTGRASSLPLPIYKIKHLGYRTILDHIVKRSQKIIVPLDSTKEDVIKTLKVAEEKIVVTYEGVDEEVVSSKYKVVSKKNKLKDSQFFLYVGNAYPHKNLDTLIKAFIRLKSHPERIPIKSGEVEGSSTNLYSSSWDSSSRKIVTQNDIKLILVGKQDYFYKKLEVKLKEERIENIEIVHNITDPELHDLYKKALAVIAPSFIEGFGLVPLEAMSNSSLILASDIPSHREVCRDAAIYFDPNNPEDLKDRLLDIINNSDSSIYRDKLELGTKRAKLFSWEKLATETLRIYEEFEK